MADTKFQTESFRPIELSAQFEERRKVSIESIVASLQSVMVGLAVNNKISRFDENVLDSLFTNDNCLLIRKDGRTIYPGVAFQGEYSFCLDFLDEQLNVCDLHDQNPTFVDHIENAWPALLTAISRVRESFANSDAALLINRTSGRLIAVSPGFTAISGLTADDATGREYGDISRELNQYFTGWKFILSNFKADEVHLSLISISAPGKSRREQSVSTIMAVDSKTESHRFIDEPHALGLHINRFNALLETNLQIAISPETLDKLDSVIAEMSDFFSADRPTKRRQLDSSNIKASMRLLFQSVLMSHRSLAGASARTDILVYRNENNEMQIKFDTPTVLEPQPQTKMNEWWQLVGKLSKRIDVRIGELQFTGNSIINRIYLATEGTKSDD